MPEIKLCAHVLRGLQTQAQEGSHDEGLLVKADTCYIPSPGMGQLAEAAATYHMHGGTCLPGDEGRCYLEPPSVRDLRAFNLFYAQGVKEHFVVGPTYYYHVQLKERIPDSALVPFEELLTKAQDFRGTYAEEWARRQKSFLQPYAIVKRVVI